MKEVIEKMKTHQWLISHDNVNIPFRVFSQRLDNQGEFGNGTAATVYIKPQAAHFSASISQALKDQRKQGSENPLTELDILDLGDASFPRIEDQEIYLVLKFLTCSPEFDMKTYSRKDSEIFHPPAPVLQLDKDDVGLQYLLGTVNIPEASYEDHDRLIDEWFNQLGWTTVAQRMKVALEKVVSWVGDQLTVDRLRGLFRMRAEDENSFERLDFSVFVFGWFHLQMAFAKSLHQQYLGTARTRGLHHAFQLLEKKGLTKALTKGPFHHDLEEAIYEVAEAHIRLDWLKISGSEKLSDLRKFNPEELHQLAVQLVRKRASSAALDEMRMKPENKRDEELVNVIMWNRDVLQYIVLDEAMRSGDVGLMEGMLPHLFIRFTGGGNGNYANEVLELLQGIHREWPAEIV